MLVLLAIGCSFAFYPKQVEPSGYIMVIGRVYTNYSLIIIGPTGETVTQIIDNSLHRNSSEKSANAFLQLQQAEIRKLNELKQAGWKITSMSIDRGDTVYILEK